MVFKKSYVIDHVGMLLRYQNGKLYLLEATNNEGVGICEWNESNIREYRATYDIIVYRQLQYKRSYELIVKLEGFLKVNNQLLFYQIL